jgi:uncharacterized protein (DUF302 family)
MGQFISKTLVCDDVDECVSCAIDLLKQEGFTVVAEADLPATRGFVIDTNARTYRILVVCDPALEKELLTIDGKFGAMAFCNVVVHEIKSGCFEVMAADPLDHAAFEKLADQCPLLDQMRENLMRAIDRL